MNSTYKNISELKKTYIVDVKNQDIYDIYIDKYGNQYDLSGKLINNINNQNITKK
jgi:hypothetical protein